MKSIRCVWRDACPQDCWMARLPRSVIPGLPTHVIQRGNNRQAAFFSSGDYREYLKSLCTAAAQNACAVHAYVLMTNHVHLLITPATPVSLSRLMQSVGRRYVRYANATYDRTGTLWEGRFRSAVVDSDRYLLTCMRYIEMNPVRAGIVNKPHDYPWSSFAYNALGAPDVTISPHPLYEALAQDFMDRRVAYSSLFHEHQRDVDGAAASIRAGTELGTPIGDSRFSASIAATLNRRVERFSHGGDRRGTKYRNLSSTLTP